MSTVGAALEARLRSEKMQVLRLPTPPGTDDDAVQTDGLARQLRADVLVLDGYDFGSDYQRIVKDSSQCLMIIDDVGHGDHYYADIVLNQNLHANEGLYLNKAPYTRLLLGTEYVLLRREFLSWRRRDRQNPETARTMLVTLGGGDTDTLTGKIVGALRALKDLEAVVVVGDGNSNLRKLQRSLQTAGSTIRIERNVTNMADLMDWAHMAVSAGGSTCWELAFMGLPNVVLALTEDQRMVAESLESEGAAWNLGWHSSVSELDLAAAISKLMHDEMRRRKMSKLGRKLVDGRGAARVVVALRREIL